MKVAKLLLFFLVSVLAYKASGQTRTTIDSLQRVRQKCLDSGARMPQCAYIYLVQLDSILTVVYDNYCRRLNLVQQQSLGAEQHQWLRKRQQYDSRVNRQLNDSLRTGAWGADMRMITIDNRSSFVERRVLALMARSEKIKDRNN